MSTEIISDSPFDKIMFLFARVVRTIILISPANCYIMLQRGRGMKKLPSLTIMFLLTVMLSGYSYGSPVFQNTESSSVKRSLANVIKRIGPRAEARIRPLFEQAGVAYPPARVTLIGLKDELELEVWAEKNGSWVYIFTYDVLAASGKSGPKQKAGDRQVPEGIYRIAELNPNSRFHLSMKLDYPNRFDRIMAGNDGRSNLGGDIYIHGKAKSRGCLAVGDAAIEELFVLAARTGPEKIQVVIVPYDLRKRGSGPRSVGPSWIARLYQTLGQELTKFRPKERV